MPFIDELLNYKNDVFIETGTFQGDTVYKIANNNVHIPKKIISLELSDVFVERCTNRFKNNDNINIIKANSSKDLLHIINDIDCPITFWLDSHWSSTDNVGCDEFIVCPIIHELEQIKHHPINTHTIMVDDIRLMNKSIDKHKGFPISIEQIINKIYEINPNYKIKFYDDYTSPNDILVAYIETKMVIHKYLTVCSTNPQPPGFADFLRGSITLFNLSKKYNYKLLFSGSHAIFTYLKPNKNIICSDTDNTLELLPPISYEEIYSNLINIFQNNKSFTILTNSFYEDSDTQQFINFGNITDDCRNFIQDILQPCDEIINKINSFNIKNFKVIHIRCGDTILHTNSFNENLYNLYYKKINNIINNQCNYILLSDSSEIAKKLKENIPTLFYWDNLKIHLGDLKNYSEQSVFDTLVDFFIMSKSNEIISNGSGFSQSVSVIYKIPYTFF